MMMRAAAVILLIGFPGVQDAPDIRPDKTGKWEASSEDVQKVLDAAVGELWQYFPDRKLDPILVKPRGGPRTLLRRGPKGEYQILLDTGKMYWAQYTYQIAHKFTHILCNYDDDPHYQRWFEEALCETASFFVLRASAETWKTKPPYASWKSYAKVLKSYAADAMKAYRLGKDETLSSWYRKNAKDLEKAARASDETANRSVIIANELLPLFEKSPASWAAVEFLNKAKLDKTTTFVQLLEAWHTNCPKKHKGFVRDVAKAFGITIKP